MQSNIFRGNFDNEISNIVATWISDGRAELSNSDYKKLLKQATPIDVRTPLYRGLNINSQQSVKPHKQLTSWTFDRCVAENFGNIVLEWNPKKPIMAVDISHINADEQEIIVRSY